MNSEKFSIRTDLALERCEILKESNSDFKDGIKIEEKQTDIFKKTTVSILNDNGSSLMGRPKGEYITIESNKLRDNDASCHSAIAQETADSLMQINNLNTAQNILIIGLGNWNITPDALGPKTVKKMLVTRHVVENIPEELKGSVRSLSAIAPGVMGITGIETFEIIKGVCDHVKPDSIIAIDALAARKFSRINSTIQISSSGISPGSGVGNRRTELSLKTLGVPVTAVGVPTVTDAATLANDTLEKIIEKMLEENTENSPFYNTLLNLREDEKYNIIYDLLEPCGENMFISTKDTDAVIERLSDILSNALNIAAHPGFKIEDIKKYCL